MDKRTLLAGEAGVLYADAAGQPRVLWAMEALELPLPEGATVQGVLAGKPITVSGTLAASRHHVYEITPPL